jgi:hypothetical protein
MGGYCSLARGSVGFAIALFPFLLLGRARLVCRVFRLFLHHFVLAFLVAFRTPWFTI